MDQKTSDRMAKMNKAKEEKRENRVKVTIGKVTLSTYNDGWIINIKSEPERYYMNLTNALKCIYDIKLRKSGAKSVVDLIARQEASLKEIVGIGKALEHALWKKNERKT